MTSNAWKEWLPRAFQQFGLHRLKALACGDEAESKPARVSLSDWCRIEKRASPHLWGCGLAAALSRQGLGATLAARASQLPNTGWPGARSRGGCGLARPVVPGGASLLAVSIRSSVVAKAAAIAIITATAKSTTAVRWLFRSLFMRTSTMSQWGHASEVPFVGSTGSLPSMAAVLISHSRSLASKR